MRIFPHISIGGVIEGVGSDVTYQQVIESKMKCNPKILKWLKKKFEPVPDELFKL